jgi:hypothetical protein
MDTTICQGPKRTRRQDWLYHGVGLGFLLLARVKYALRGYRCPKPFALADYDRCCDYDFRVVDNWLSVLERYTGSAALLTGGSVLELGPGSDLGVGLYLLSKGAARYTAMDVNDLVGGACAEFYDRFFHRLGQVDPRASVADLRMQLRGAQEGRQGRLNYICREDFDIASACGAASVDLVFSQAAFEHFDDVGSTVSQLSEVARPGAVIVAEIDLKAHSRWIRDKDPNSIYRYSHATYNLFRFRGSPNRVRPYQYKEAFERSGWGDVVITPLSVLEEADGCQAGRFLDKQFRDARNQMNWLGVMLCARKL